MSDISPSISNRPTPMAGTVVVLFVLLQVAVMAVAISNESLWIDEFWTAHFATLGSMHELYELILIPSGSQTPLHFSYYYFWGLLFEPTELSLRLANLPLFVLGQLSLLWALRTYDRKFCYLFLAVSALHPMVWQYANEARPYIMIYAGAQMMLAYLLHLRSVQGTHRPVNPLFTAIFVVGGILLFGASLLGVFWVFSACLYALYLHRRGIGWNYLIRGVTPFLIGIFIVTVTLLSVYYLSSLLKGAGGSRIASTTPATMAFAAYELLGLSGVGPSRHDLRESGLAALRSHGVGLFVATVTLLFVLYRGALATVARLDRQELVVVTVLAVLPLVIVVFSGFVMHWRVLGRHLLATLPVLNLLFALGLATLVESRAGGGRVWRWGTVVAFFLVLGYSSGTLRFSERHRKDDYRTAASVALEAVAQGKRVWWAADYLGANYYRLPGEFDYMGELTSRPEPPICHDLPGVQATANLPSACMLRLSEPDIVVLSRPEAFDKSGELAAYMQARNFVKIREMPAIDIWQPIGPAFPAGR